MSIYTKLENTAVKLILKFGYAGTILRNGTDSHPVRLVMTQYDPRYVDGNLIQHTDRKALIAAKGMAIVPDAEQDKLIAGSETLRIVTVTKTSPGGEDIIYELQVRR